MQVGTRVFNPTSTQTIQVNNPGNPDSYLAIASLLPQYPGYQLAEVVLNLADDSGTALSSDAQPPVLPFASFTSTHYAALNWTPSCGTFGTITANLTGYTSSGAPTESWAPRWWRSTPAT